MERGIETMILGGGETKSMLTLEGDSIIDGAKVGEEMEITIKVKLVKDELEDEIGPDDVKGKTRCQKFEVVDKKEDDTGSSDEESAEDDVGEGVRKTLSVMGKSKLL